MTVIGNAITWAVDEMMSHADPRMKKLPLMNSPFYPLCIEAAFIAFIIFGPKIMKDRKPFSLKTILIIYNPLMTVFNFFLFFSICIKIFTRKAGSITCALVDKSETQDGYEIVYIGWLTFISKVVELSDTIFFILRKKDRQLSFLHLYHHSTVVINSWLCNVFVPGGQVWLAAVINTFIHVIMYGYYTLAALGPHMQKYLWWKKYLTTLQMAQFIIVMTHCFVNQMVECEFPKLYNETMIPYYLSQFLLFYNFYRKSYTSRNVKKDS